MKIIARLYVLNRIKKQIPTSKKSTSSHHTKKNPKLTQSIWKISIIHVKLFFLRSNLFLSKIGSFLLTWLIAQLNIRFLFVLSLFPRSHTFLAFQRHRIHRLFWFPCFFIHLHPCGAVALCENPSHQIEYVYISIIEPIKCKRKTASRGNWVNRNKKINNKKI